MDELRFIVQELNKLFDHDYNMISFGSLSETQILQVLVNILSNVGAMSEIDVSKNKEQSVMNILMALQSIKYVPSNEITANEFREGLIMGRRNIVHPIMFWLLSNVEKVKKRVYFARYVEKVDIPPEISGEPEINNLLSSYDRIIEEFWISYHENHKEKKNAEESTELQEDTKKMTSDMNNLVQRLDLQNDKLKNIPNRETLLNSVKSYRNERKQQEKLQHQLRVHKNLLIQMDTDIKTIEAKRQSNNRGMDRSDPSKQIRDELQINKILIEGQLPKEYEEVSLELRAFERVAQESEPSQDEMDDINTEFESLSNHVQGLLNKKITLTNTNDDQLLPFRNQASIIANKKQELSSFIMKIKTKNDSILKEVEEKSVTLRELVGGDILHGEDLKKFISNLRERSIVYKKIRAHLQGLQVESSVATRTLEILKLQDPSIMNAIKSKKENVKNKMNNDELALDDVVELKNRCKRVYQEASLRHAEAQKLFEDLTRIRSRNDSLKDDFYEKKREFDNATGNMTDEIAKLEQSFEEFGDHIEREETQWKDAMKEVEKYEMIINKYSETITNSMDMSAVIEKIVNDLKISEKSKKQLENEIGRLQEMKDLQNDEAEQIHRLSQMILFKFQSAY